LYDNDDTKGTYTIGSGLSSNFTTSGKDAEPRHVGALDDVHKEASSLHREDREGHSSGLKMTMRDDDLYEQQKHDPANVAKQEERQHNAVEKDVDDNEKSESTGIMGKVGNMLGVV
jgi:hypothetical protein